MVNLTWIVFDILGTVAFAISGAMVGITKRMDIFGIAVLAILTAVGGGILRDVMAQRLPVVFYADFYAAAAILGAIALCLAENFSGDLNAASWIGFFAVAALRFLAIHFSWSLYHPKKGAT